jgi:16S rRNA processing protein RimM
VFGVRGELKLDASRIGADGMRAGVETTVRFATGETRTMTVAAVRLHQDRPLIRFTGVDDANAAQRFVGAQLTIAREAAPLYEGEYFDDDLIGCRIVDEAGVEHAKVTGVLHYPNQDLLQLDRQSTLLPLVKAFIARVDTAQKTIHVTVPPGLLDPAEADEA